jgi:GDPmannose 4,6-dehydratase
MKTALITGIAGQDGSYLSELLLSKGYVVHGIERWSRLNQSERKDEQNKFKLDERITLHNGDMTDSASLHRILEKSEPDEIYNLAAQSHVGASFDIPEYTGNVTGLGCTRILDAICRVNPKIRFYQASSSEMFGKVVCSPQCEKTPFYPRSPYGVAKLYAHWITINYRESYGVHASNGILFNHESPRRGESFVTRKITKGIANILAGKQKEIFLGNIEAKRDWGHAKDYVEAMWLMLQQDVPDDYVVATNETHSVREFLEESFGLVNLDWRKYVKTSPDMLRPAEVDLLLGDSSKARKVLGWKPKYDFKGLVKDMVLSDLSSVGIVEYKETLQRKAA